MTPIQMGLMAALVFGAICMLLGFYLVVRGLGAAGGASAARAAPGVLFGLFGLVLIVLSVVRMPDASRPAPSGGPVPRLERVSAPPPRAYEPTRVTNWEAIDKVGAFRLGQWAALIEGYNYPPDPLDDPGYRPWRDEFFFLKRAIEAGDFQPNGVDRRLVTRSSLISRADITAFYASERRFPRALSPLGY